MIPREPNTAAICKSSLDLGLHYPTTTTSLSTKTFRLIVVCLLVQFSSMAVAQVQSPAPSSIHPLSDTPLTSVEVIAGPSTSPRTKCANVDRIGADHYLTLHYNISIDQSSPKGDRGRKVDTTYRRHEGQPDTDPIMIRMIDVNTDPMLGWIKGMMGLCSGDFVTMVVPSDLAYGEEGDGGYIPGGAVLKINVHIITAHPDPEKHFHQAYINSAEKMFHEMDSNGDGIVTREEMEIYFDVPEDYPNRDRFVEQHYQLADYNKDGTVSLEELKLILENFQGIDEL